MLRVGHQRWDAVGVISPLSHAPLAGNSGENQNVDSPGTSGRAASLRVRDEIHYGEALGGELWVRCTWRLMH